MSDRVAVMNEGNVEQIDPPRRLYDQPETAFVAGFIGTSNLLTVTIDRRDNGVSTAMLGDGTRICCPDPAGTAPELTFTVRPEKIKLVADTDDIGCRIRGTVVENVYLGSMTRFWVRVGERLFMVESQHGRFFLDDEKPLQWGDEVWVCWHANDGYMLENFSEEDRQLLSLPDEDE